MYEMKCSCAQGYHKAALEQIVLESGALAKVPDILKDYHQIFVLSDETTYQVAGAAVIEELQAAGMYFQKIRCPRRRT